MRKFLSVEWWPFFPIYYGRPFYFRFNLSPVLDKKQVNFNLKIQQPKKVSIDRFTDLNIENKYKNLHVRK